MKIVIKSTGSIGGASAPANASYVTLASESTLTSERRLSAGSGINITDNGPNNTVIISAVGGGGGGPSYFDSTINASVFTTGSTAFVGQEHVASPSQKGTDVFFYVSGSVGTHLDKSLFGGDVFVSGSMLVANGMDVLASGLEITGSLVVTGSAKIIGDLSMSGSIIPTDDKTFDLGAANKRWSNVYTGDLHLRNERGDWTIVEEQDFLCVVNNITGKKYKMMLQPLDE